MLELGFLENLLLANMQVDYAKTIGCRLAEPAGRLSRRYPVYYIFCNDGGFCVTLSNLADPRGVTTLVHLLMELVARAQAGIPLDPPPRTTVYRREGDTYTTTRLGDTLLLLSAYSTGRCRVEHLLVVTAGVDGYAPAIHT